MRKACPSEQRHERCLERSQALKEISQRPFSADRIAYQHSEKIKGFIGAESPTYQTHLLGQGFKQNFRRQVAGNDCYFRKPRRHRRAIFSGGLDFNTAVGYHK
jgi:hypothetical protein